MNGKAHDVVKDAGLKKRTAKTFKKYRAWKKRIKKPSYLMMDAYIAKIKIQMVLHSK